jgi:hypothetical protein
MSEDLVKRLRNASVYEQYKAVLSDLGDEAADEIERLRAIVSIGIEVRTRQTAYFKSRTKEDLIASKQAEDAFDKAAKP